MTRIALLICSLAACAGDDPPAGSGHLDVTLSQVASTNVDATPFAGEVTHTYAWSDQTKVAVDNGTRRIMLVLPKPLDAGTYAFNGETFASVDVLQNFAACDAGTDDCLWWETSTGMMTVALDDDGSIEITLSGSARAALEPAVGTFAIEGHGVLTGI